VGAKDSGGRVLGASKPSLLNEEGKR
jgi:hypothetical protein